jgi:hypothetical protein
MSTSSGNRVRAAAFIWLVAVTTVDLVAPARTSRGRVVCPYATPHRVYRSVSSRALPTHIAQMRSYVRSGTAAKAPHGVPSGARQRDHRAARADTHSRDDRRRSGCVTT